MKSEDNIFENKEICTYKKFNLNSFLISLNYFVTPFVIMLIIVNVLGIHPIYLPNPLENEKNTKIFFTILSSISMFIAMIISLILARKRTDSISSESSSFSFKNLILLGLGLGILTIVSTFTILNIYRMLGMVSESKNTKHIVEYINSSKIMLVSILIVAPVGEEITFKYGIFTFFHELFYDKCRFLKVIIPACISAFIFSILHDGLYLTPVYFLPNFIGCLVYEKTKKIFPCVLGHFINNLISTIILLK